MLYPYPTNYGSDARFGNDGNVRFLLNFNGANGSTSFIDDSTNKYTVTAAGAAALSTTQAKFGPSSLLPGAGGAAVIADNASLEPGNGSFTFECWVYPTSTTLGYIIGKSATDAGFSPFYIVTDTSFKASASSNGSSNDVFTSQSIGSVTTSTWQHIALVRSGNNFYGFLNGVQGFTTSSSATLIDNSASWRIGNYSNDLGFPFNGYIDQVRYSNVARWITNFTPPPMPYGL